MRNRHDAFSLVTSGNIGPGRLDQPKAMMERRQRASFYVSFQDFNVHSPPEDFIPDAGLSSPRRASGGMHAEGSPQDNRNFCVYTQTAENGHTCRMVPVGGSSPLNGCVTCTRRRNTGAPFAPCAPAHPIPPITYHFPQLVRTHLLRMHFKAGGASGRVVVSGAGRNYGPRLRPS